MSISKAITKHLQPIARVTDFSADENYVFCAAFARIFTADTPNYPIGKGMYGASRSNWTYQTAFAIAQTAKVFGWSCRFECSGKRDAVIETMDEDPVVLLYAEWEWDYLDIFGKGKELEKLKASCKASTDADAFLLVYCPEGEFPEYLERIVNFWQKEFPVGKPNPALFINTVIFKQRASTREFVSLQSCMIHDTEVWILSDIPL